MNISKEQKHGEIHPLVARRREGPGFGEAFRFWLKLGFISFGGPAGQIAILHRELVEVRKWISDRQFMQALNFCMVLPGPEAQQLATYLGWRLHGAKGAIVAGGLFVLPAMFILYGLSWLYVAGGEWPWLSAIFHGLMPAVIAVVFEALLRIGGKALRRPAFWILAAMSFVAMYVFKVSFVLILLTAAAVGGLGHRWWPRHFPAGPRHAEATQEEDGCVVLPEVPRASWRRTLKILSVCLVLWWGPIFGVAAWQGWSSTPAQQGLFFSKAALVTFGGAYAVLPYVAQQAVDTHGWLTHPQMMTGLALAETTPGPLIMVLQFVGFVGGWQHPGEFSPVFAATLGALLTTWVTFMPCFLFIFLGAPHVEQLGTMRQVSAAMAGITAAVVGVILNLAVTFAVYSLWPEGGGGVGGTFDWFVASAAVVAFAALKVFRAGLIPVILACAAAGLVVELMVRL
ncbi:MAG TPA: chromate efflux transporter [Kiritimatiellia bacterium]|nr:chromate efflux transporter [Kiritimatiellia bacterium]